MSTRTCRSIAMCLAALLGGGVPAVCGALGVDINSRASSRAFYNDVYLASDGEAIGWTGSHAACNEGTVAAGFQDAVLLRVNYFRVMAGMAEVTFDGTYNANCQKAALMISRNNELNHHPPPSWYCFSAAGSNACYESNLSLGYNGWDAVAGQMRDSGANNYFCGHRRWILMPNTLKTGSGNIPLSGSYPATMALHAWDDNWYGARPPTRDAFVSWPPAGYVPYTVVFGRWSFAYDDADFSGSTVSMTEDGAAISATLETLEEGYGENTLVWRPKGVSDSYTWPQPGADISYTVTVNNVLIGGSPQSFKYTVIVFDPAVSGATPPATPTGVAATDGTLTNKVRVTWNASSGAASYQVWRSTINDADEALLLRSGLSQLSYEDLTVVPEEYYYYFVRAQNSDGYSDYSTGNRGHAAMAPPDAPTGVTASDGKFTDEVRVRWEPCAGATLYQLWRNDSNDLNSASRLKNVGAHLEKAHDYDATPGDVYYYWMRAENQGGWGPFSDGDSGYASVAPDPPPEPPDTVWASDGTYGNKIYVLWQLPPEAHGFHIWRSLGSDPAAACQVYTNHYGGGYSDYDVFPGWHYYYWIQSWNEAGTSDFSVCDDGYANIALNPPAIPSCISATDGTYSDRVRVHWCPVIAADGYEVWRNTSNSTDGATRLAQVSASDSDYDDMTAPKGVTNYYFATASNSYGCSGFTAGNAGHALGVPLAPSDLVASDGADSDRITLNWNSESGFFDIWRNLHNTPSTATRIRTNESGIGYADITMIPGLTYYYWVTLKQNNMTSEFSNGDSGYASAVTSPPPAWVSASQGTYTGKVLVTWCEVPTADRYDVWRNTVNSTSGATRIAANLPATSRDDTSALKTQGYWYWIKSVSPGNMTSTWSEAAYGFRAGPLSEPEILAMERAWILVGLSLTNLTVGRTHYIEYTTALGDDATWVRRGSLEPSLPHSWWIGLMLGRSTSLFYRVVAEPED